MSDRYNMLMDWLNGLPGGAPQWIEPASRDASFRRYYRVGLAGGGTRVAMDAPPELYDSRIFTAVARTLADLGLHVPEILAADLERGLLLLTDLGSRQYLQVLDAANADALYGDALAALARLQTRADPLAAGLPDYDDAFVVRELEIFREWYLGRHLGLSLAAVDQALLDEAFAVLRAAALEQPRVWMHRDYHSRNLMVTDRHNPGILDFQDSVRGPLTYDLVSLLRDCYIRWPRQRVTAWALEHRARLRALGMTELGADAAQFLRWFDLMGAQRHLKAAGIFARLHQRDGRGDYLKDIPRTLGYVREVAAAHPELAGLGAFLDRVAPCGP